MTVDTVCFVPILCIYVMCSMYPPGAIALVNTVKICTLYGSFVVLCGSLLVGCYVAELLFVFKQLKLCSVNSFVTQYCVTLKQLHDTYYY